MQSATADTTCTRPDRSGLTRLRSDCQYPGLWLVQLCGLAHLAICEVRNTSDELAVGGGDDVLLEQELRRSRQVTSPDESASALQRYRRQ